MEFYGMKMLAAAEEQKSNQRRSGGEDSLIDEAFKFLSQ
jgi:hypothetical protein